MSVSRAVLVTALLACGGAMAVPAAAQPLPCRVYVYPPEIYYTPWGAFGYVNTALPHVECD